MPGKRLVKVIMLITPKIELTNPITAAPKILTRDSLARKTCTLKQLFECIEIPSGQRTVDVLATISAQLPYGLFFGITLINRL